MSDQRFECVYCGQEHGSPNGTGSDISCCGEAGHVRPIGEGFNEIQPGSILDEVNRMAALIGKPPVKAPRA